MTIPLGPPPADNELTALLAQLGRLIDSAGPSLHSAGALLDLVNAQVRTLQQRLAAQRAVFDALPDPVCVLDPDGIVLDVNPSGLAAYQRQRHEVVGQPIDLLNPDLPAHHLQPVREVLERGMSYQLEVSNMRSDGSRFPVEVHSAAVTLDGQHCIVAIARQLGPRWEVQNRNQLLVECMDKGVVLIDRQMHLVGANPAAYRLLGLDALPAHPIDGVKVGDDWHVVDEHGHHLPPAQWPVMRAFRQGRSGASTVIGLHHPQDGHLIWLSVSVVPVFGCDARTPEHVYALFTDITDIKRDAALFERTQALAHIGGWEWDIARQRLFLTSQAIRILGRQRPPDTFQGLLDCLHPASRQALEDAVTPLNALPGCFELELQGVRSNGERFWVRMIGESELALPPSLRLVGTLQDITERRRAEEKLRIAAHTDALTGAMNRDALLAELSQRLQAGQPTAALYIDLDHFKLVNDVLGHAAGDRLLVQATERILGALGGRGLLGRMGGDEFMVICAVEADRSLPEHLADALVAAFVPAFLFGQDRFTVTPSIGIAVSPEHGTQADQLTQNADAAMYECKRHTRNGWRYFCASLAQRQQHRLQIEGRLRQALDNQAFHLVYQPKVDLRDGRIVGVEALIRWYSEQLGELRPDLFISHAENTGDIQCIGTWVLDQACAQVRRWWDDGLGLLPVAVNVSYRQFAGDALVEAVEQALARHRLPGHALELEFTERVLIQDLPQTAQAIARLQARGVQLSIDDFGEGYSALSYLRRLPINGLKLSALFVANIADNPQDVAVCQAVQGIAHSLGLGLVAEGVETAAQRDQLLALGIHIGQGFLYAPGLSPTDLAHWLGEGRTIALP